MPTKTANVADYAVFYDDRCSLCCRCMQFLTSIDAYKRMLPLPMNQPESLADYPELQGRETAMREGIHIVHCHRRQVWVGEEAVAIILKACGGTWWVLGTLLQWAIALPIVGVGIRYAYRWVSRHRYQLLERLGL